MAEVDDDGRAARAEARARARAVRRVGILLGLVRLPDLSADELAAVFAHRIALVDGLTPAGPGRPGAG